MAKIQLNFQDIAADLGVGYAKEVGLEVQLEREN